MEELSWATGHTEVQSSKNLTTPQSYGWGKKRIMNWWTKGHRLFSPLNPIVFRILLQFPGKMTVLDAKNTLGRHVPHSPTRKPSKNRSQKAVSQLKRINSGPFLEISMFKRTSTPRRVFAWKFLRLGFADLVILNVPSG